MHEWNLELREARLGPRHPETLLSCRGLSLAYRRAGRLDEAIAMDRRTLELSEAKLGPDHRDTIESRVNLVRDYRDAGRLDEAIAVDRRTLELREAALGPDHRDTIQSRSNLILLYQRAGDEARAEPLLGATWNSRRREVPRARRSRVRWPRWAAACSSRASAPSPSRSYGQSLDDSLAQGTDEWSCFYVKSLLGGSLLGQRRYAEAEQLLIDGYEGLKHGPRRGATLASPRRGTGSWRCTTPGASRPRPPPGAPARPDATARRRLRAAGRGAIRTLIAQFTRRFGSSMIRQHSGEPRSACAGRGSSGERLSLLIAARFL